MNNKESRLKDFVMMPRKIRDDRLSGKLTRNNLNVLDWIWISTNPYNGCFTADYKALEREFSANEISYDNMRKIVSSLRKGQYIYFSNHNGRNGSFPIYPIGFQLTNGKIQTLDYLTNKLQITTQTQSGPQSEAIPEHNLSLPDHNFEDQKSALTESFSMDHATKPITTPYNDKDNKNNIKIDGKKSLKESNAIPTHTRVPVNGFRPKTYEEELCWKIAHELGEVDMRFILSCLKKYGFGHIERAWGIFKETPQENINSKPKYFNKLIRNLGEQNSESK